MRDRLIELIRQAKTEVVCYGEPATKWQRNIVDRAEANDLADYLLANGVIVPPCKVGDTIYYVDTYEHAITNFIVISIGFCCLKNNYISTTIQFEDEKGHREFNYQFFDSYFGKTVFFTKEEAEEKLKEME